MTPPNSVVQPAGMATRDSSPGPGRPPREGAASIPTQVRLSPDERARAEAALEDRETLSDFMREGMEVLIAIRALNPGVPALEWVKIAHEDHARLSSLVEELDEEAKRGDLDVAGRRLLRRLDPVAYDAAYGASSKRRERAK